MKSKGEMKKKKEKKEEYKTIEKIQKNIQEK